MGGGNGAKAQQKRERNAKKATKENTSQKDLNEKAKNKVCALCNLPLHTTARAKIFQDHMDKFHPGEPIEKGFAAYL